MTANFGCIADMAPRCAVSPPIIKITEAGRDNPASAGTQRVSH
jgi:hypothetical protein